MDLEAVGNIGEAVGAAAVVVSLLYLVVQIRQNTRSIRAATYQSIVAAAAGCNQTLSQSKALARVMRLGGGDPSALDEDEQVQFDFLCLQFFDIFENLHLQHVHGHLDEEYWRPRRRAFLALFESPGFAERWAGHRENYTRSFREMVEEGLAAMGGGVVSTGSSGAPAAEATAVLDGG